CTKSIC
nr:Chain I, CYS-THR-LYS-SER-ILE-CYS [Vigna unguiculata]